MTLTPALALRSRTKPKHGAERRETVVELYDLISRKPHLWRNTKLIMQDEMISGRQIRSSGLFHHLISHNRQMAPVSHSRFHRDQDFRLRESLLLVPLFQQIPLFFLDTRIAHRHLYQAHPRTRRLMTASALHPIPTVHAKLAIRHRCRFPDNRHYQHT